MMYYCCNFFAKSKHPEFYKGTIELMRKANHCAFLTSDDLNVFCAMLKKNIDAHKPMGHKAHIEKISQPDGHGQISLESGKVDFQIARLYFYPVNRVLEYDYEAGDFFPVDRIDHIEEGGDQ